MNVSQMIMKFELFPNEILIEILKYLNLFDIFYSFHYLNDHFNQLIRSIPLHLNFKSISKSTFDKFCQLLKLNPEIKNQVYSLELSNKDTFGQIEMFLSIFPLNEFSYLHSLTLIQLEKNNIEKLTSMLPFISGLHSCYLIDSDNIILPISLPSNLQTLSLPTLQLTMNNFFSITNLSISICSIARLLSQLFRYAPMLKYLKVQNISQYDTWRRNDLSNITYKAIHLEQLIILNFEYKFTDFEKLIKHTSNIISLELCGCFDDIDMIDANQWEHLITNSLSRLDIFKFIFNFIGKNDKKYILEKFQQFQRDFWLVKHHWYTEYSLSKYFLLIYTVPYMLDYYELYFDTNRYWNQSLNTFDKVTNLTLYVETSKEESYQYYFSNVTSLTIFPLKQVNTGTNLYLPTINSLKTLVNLSNLIHFGISSKFKLHDRSFLLKLLQESPRLSSMKIDAHLVQEVLFFDYYGTSDGHLKKMIKKMDIYKYGYPSIKFRWDLDRFCQIFSNIEQLKCTLVEQNDLLFLFRYLPKLSILKSYILYLKDHIYFQYWFKKETSKLNLLYQIKYTHTHETELLVWIDRKIN